MLKNKHIFKTDVEM